jgi:hypothetical protein
LILVTEPLRPEFETVHRKQGKVSTEAAGQARSLVDTVVRAILRLELAKKET